MDQEISILYECRWIALSVGPLKWLKYPRNLFWGADQTSLPPMSDYDFNIEHNWNKSEHNLWWCSKVAMMQCHWNIVNSLKSWKAKRFLIINVYWCLMTQAQKKLFFKEKLYSNIHETTIFSLTICLCFSIDYQVIAFLYENITPNRIH